MTRLVALVATAAVLAACSPNDDPGRLCDDVAESRIRPSNALMWSILRNMPPQDAAEFSLVDDITEAYGLWDEGDAYGSTGRDHLRRWGAAYLAEYG